MAVERELISAEVGEISPVVAYESTDVSARRISLIAGGVLLTALLGAVFVALPFYMFKWHRTDVLPQRSPEAPAGLRQPPEPRLQASPELDLKGYTDAYNKVLRSYAWVDQAKGMAAIPLDRAIQIAGERGIPRFPVNPRIPLSQPREATRLTGFQGKVVPPPQ